LVRPSGMWGGSWGVACLLPTMLRICKAPNAGDEKGEFDLHIQHSKCLYDTV
jgi:hypothetical protein